MRILIVEDEPKTAAYLSTGLKDSGYSVSSAFDGKEALFLASEYEYDLIILDVMLPKLDGWTVLTKLRTFAPDVKILFLTARDALKDKIKGFELGADDYLVKPFAFSELLCRVKSLLKRPTKQTLDKLTIGDLEIDLTKHKIFRCKEQIYLTSQEFALLIFLAERQGEVLSRTLIAETVWDINFHTETNVVDVAIRRLRQKIDFAFEKKLIHTIRGLGYVLEDR